MTVCTFVGHRQVFAAGLEEKLDKTLDILLCRDNEFVFYIGGMGEFDAMCSAAVHRARARRPGLDIRLILVLPYMKQELNKNRDLYERRYDGIVIPDELLGMHCKAAIGKRNEWMLQRAGVLIAFVYRSFGGAFETLRRAQGYAGLEIINLASDALI